MKIPRASPYVRALRLHTQEAKTGVLSTDAYKRAHELRQLHMRETSIGIHSARVENTVTLVTRS